MRTHAFRAPGDPVPKKPPVYVPLPVLPADAGIGIPELAQSDPNPMGLSPRVFRMIGNAMEPTLLRNDLLVAVPVSTYNCEGLYILSFGPGQLSLYRCECRGRDSIHAWKDNKALGFETLVLTRAEFEDAVLAQVAITGRLVAAGLLPEMQAEGFVA